MQLIYEYPERYHPQADPFIFEDEGKFYIYATGKDGVLLFTSDNLFEGWKFYGEVFSLPGHKFYWAPSVIKMDGEYYMYVSCEWPEWQDETGHIQAMCCGRAKAPEGPFEDIRPILRPFSIDSHIVKNENGLFLFYSKNSLTNKREGTYIVVDRMLDPYTPERRPVSVVEPTLDEEIFARDRFTPGHHWHTIEGAFYFREGDWHYVMYSGNCFQTPNYYVGYAAAKTSENDLTKIKFKKMPDENTYAPVLAKNEWEEGTGHHSVIKHNGVYYAVYHGRNLTADGLKGDRRNARICRLEVNDGIITAVRKKDGL